MELKQLRYFLHVVEVGSMSKAAQDLGIVTSALSQQISRLESKLSTRLLQRTSTGVIPTAAGLAFCQEAQLAVRHALNAVQAAKLARLSGHVSVGLAPTTGSILAVPFYDAMKERYPGVQLHLVESLSGNLAELLNRRQIDLAVLFHTGRRNRWSTQAILQETLFLISDPSLQAHLPQDRPLTPADLKDIPLVMPSATHGLRALADAAFLQCGEVPNVVAEIDGLALLMDVVRSGHAATIHPGAAAVRPPDRQLALLPLTREGLVRRNLITSPSDDELSPTALAARVVLADVMRTLVTENRWPGATLLAAGQ